MLLLAIALQAAPADLSRQAYDVLKRNCFSCHGAAMQMSGLDLRTRQSILTGGQRGPAVEPTILGRSPLYQLASHQQKPAMPPVPPGQKLSDPDLEILRRWIIAGAPLDGVAEAADPGEAARKAALAKLEDRPITPEERQYWAFRPPVRPDTPGSIDAFLLAGLRSKGLSPSSRADPRTLIRRAYLDLTGLPPSPSEVSAFVQDSSPAAWERLIDRLLASPHYGERWGRYWLDLVRYADSGGFERDFDWPNAWRYRDYVVRAFNEDRPYNQFLREQIAGDEIDPASDEAVIATGYLRLGPDNNVKDERTRMDELDDLIHTTSVSFLGLTVGCARCHNHKFDPIAQKDYYRLQAVFFSTKAAEHPLAAPDVVAAHEAEQKNITSRQAPLREAKGALEVPYRERLLEEKLSTLPDYVRTAWHTPFEKRTDGQRLNVRQIMETFRPSDKEIRDIMPEEDQKKHRDLTTQIAALEKQRPRPYPTAMVIGEHGRDPLPSYFLHRGSPDVKGSLMPPGVLAVLSTAEPSFPAPPPDARSSFRRRGLAEWIASPQNPLTARVLVNRLWQHHFGEGIVRTPSNFGRTGQRPSHPELLDWLATEFVQRGWSIKAMHRLILMSGAYQMASDDIAASAAIDPENRYFWRMPRVRLDAETLRDQMLAVAGTLDLTVGGPAVFPYINPDLFQSSTSRTWPGKPDDDPSTWRRSIYVFTKRSIRYPMFETFDQPDTISSCDRRNRSTIATQALLLMNNQLVLQQSGRFAERVQKEAGPDRDAQIRRAYQLGLGRLPTESEQSLAAKYVASDGLADFCHLLFNLNEFVYRP